MTNSRATMTSTARREFFDATIFAVETRSTGLRGGDGGHGGESAVVFEDCGGTCWQVETDGKVFEYPKSVTITVWGDSEGQNLLRALEQASTQLRFQLLIDKYREVLVGAKELSKEERNQVEADLDAIEEEIASAQPKPSLRQRLQRLEGVLVSGALSGVETTTKDGAVHLIHAALRVLFGG